MATAKKLPSGTYRYLTCLTFFLYNPLITIKMPESIEFIGF